MEEKEVEFNLYTDGSENINITSDIEEFEDYLTIEEECSLAMYIIQDIAKRAMAEDLENAGEEYQDVEHLDEDTKMDMEVPNLTNSRDQLIYGIINIFYFAYAEVMKMPKYIHEFAMGIYRPFTKVGETYLYKLINTAYSDEIKSNEITQTAVAILIDLANDMADNGLKKDDIMEIIKDELDSMYEIVDQSIDFHENKKLKSDEE